MGRKVRKVGESQGGGLEGRRTGRMAGKMGGSQGRYKEGREE